MDKEVKTNEETREEEKKAVMHEDSDGNYRYRGFWSGFGDQ